jgi:hypothetical protein
MLQSHDDCLSSLRAWCSVRYACDDNCGSSDKKLQPGDSARRSANNGSPTDDVGFLGQSLDDEPSFAGAISDIFSIDILDPHYTTTTYVHASTLQSPIATNRLQHSRHLTSTHTYLFAMFRRVAAAVPAQAGRVLATAARPSIASPIRTAAPTVSATGRRQYHEKDKSIFCAMAVLVERWQGPETLPSRTSHPLPSHTSTECPANIRSTARPLQPSP